MATKAKFYIATSEGWVETDFGGNSSFYGVCESAATTTIKEVTDVVDFELKTGVSINIKFTYAHTSTSIPTLNINSTGQKTIRRNGSTSLVNWAAGAIVNFVYDGTYWVITDASARDTHINYYHTPTYTSGTKIATGVGVEDLYIPNTTAQAQSLSYTTTPPTSANTNGVKLVVLNSSNDTQTKYNGYLYIII